MGFIRRQGLLEGGLLEGGVYWRAGFIRGRGLLEVYWRWGLLEGGVY